MVKNIEDFINYAYTPMRKKQCIKDLLFIWAASIIVCMLGQRKVFWIASLGITALSVTAYFAFLMVERIDAKETKFICEGISSLHIAVLFNLGSYRVMVLGSEPKPFLMLLFLLLLIISILVFLLVVKRNIKRAFYSTEQKNTKTALWSLVGGASGIISARIFLADVIAQKPTVFFSSILLLLSFAIGSGSLNLLKVYYSHCS